MLSFQVMTAKDRREAAAIERRRALEEERKKRIFNPRARMIGVDAEELRAQIDEKKKREADLRRVERCFNENLRKADELAVAHEKKERQERLRTNLEINEFRKTFQKPEDRREFDLNDPNLMKKQLPCRLHDEDPRLGPSAAQKFEGEDLASDQRLKLQNEQIRAWLDQQMQEKDAAERERKMAEDAYKAAVMARDQRALELDRLEKDCRKKLEQTLVKFNQALANERMGQREMQKRETTQDDMAEIYNMLTSDMLTENPETAQSNLGLGRKITSIYRGMSDEDRRRIHEDQMKQIREAHERREQEKKRNQQMDDYINGLQRSIASMDRELERKEKERQKQLEEENKQMANEQITHKKYLDKIVYSNVPTKDFWDQFNKSSR